MAGKRKRNEDAAVVSLPHQPCTTNATLLTAVAAARIKGEASAKEVPASGIARHLLPAASVSSSPGTPAAELEESEEEHRPNVKLCNWRNEPQNVLSDSPSKLTIKLDKHSTIALVGWFRLKVTKGAVNFKGANISAVSHGGRKDRLYTCLVPSTGPIFKIRGIDSFNLVELTNVEDPAPLIKISPPFADLWHTQSGTDTRRSFSIITESHADPLARPLIAERTPEDWLRAIEDCAGKPSIISVVGPPSCGKSTFAGRLTNRYLTGQGKSAKPVPAVCYLDLDPRRPEYTPHGQLSLVLVKSLNLGPSFMRPATIPSPHDNEQNQTIRAHAIPMNLVDYIGYYRACAEDLFQMYKTLQSRDSSLPLIINFPGSLYASNPDMLLELLARFKPNGLVHMGDMHTIDTETATRLHDLQTISIQYCGAVHGIFAQFPVKATLRTEVELRNIHMQSYFHLRGDVPGKLDPPAWTSDCISTKIPWEFCYQETPERTQDFTGFAMYCEPIEHTTLVQALEGTIVHIVETTSSAIPSPYTNLPRTNKFGIPYFSKSKSTGMVEPLDPKVSRLVCTGLVRGFDPRRKMVQILVPPTHESLLHSLVPERTILVGGCCDTPNWAYLEITHGVEQIQNPNASRHMDPAGAAPWIDEKVSWRSMGYLTTVRRVRKFQT